jgi:o-succinylbenzoate synthase
MELAVERHELRFRGATKTARGTLKAREIAVISLIDADGVRGRGEAAPLSGFHGVTLDECIEALDAITPKLTGSLEDVAAVLEEAEVRAALPAAAMAALDIALWDLRAQYEQRPISALLGDSPLDWVEVNAPIRATTAADGAAECAQAADEGFRAVKLKAGIDEDVALVRAVRAAIPPDVAIRIDANGAWDVDTACAKLEELEPFGVELCEEPVHGVEALAAVRERSPIPIAMDETAHEPGAAGTGVTDLVCLKLAAQGGISGIVEAGAAARAAGTDVYLGSSYDGAVGIAAAIHTAAALRVERSCGLATLAMFEGIDDPLPVIEGGIAVPTGVGLGI